MEMESEEVKESIVKSLKKLEMPYILITDRFHHAIPGDWEYLMYFSSPLRIDALLSDINMIERRKGLQVVVLCDWREYEGLHLHAGSGRDEAAVMREWLSGSRCRIASIDEGEDCGRCDFCLSPGKDGLTDTEIRLLAMLRADGKLFARGRLFELGYGLHLRDLAFPGYGVLRGIRRDAALGALFTLKNKGLIEFSGRGTEILIRGI